VQAPGSLPFFGHAIALGSRCGGFRGLLQPLFGFSGADSWRHSTPWDQFAEWAWDAKKKLDKDLVVVDFFFDVRRASLVPVVSYVFFFLPLDSRACW
jgi:hypothetical protein